MSKLTQMINTDERLELVSMEDAEVRGFLTDQTSPVLCTPAVAVTVAGVAAGAAYGEVVD